MTSVLAKVSGAPPRRADFSSLVQHQTTCGASSAANVAMLAPSPGTMDSRSHRLPQHSLAGHPGWQDLLRLEGIECSSPQLTLLGPWAPPRKPNTRAPEPIKPRKLSSSQQNSSRWSPSVTAHCDICLANTNDPSRPRQQTFFSNFMDATDPPPVDAFPSSNTSSGGIGAGPTGLQTAAELLQANLTVRPIRTGPVPWRQLALHRRETAVRETYPETNSTGPEWYPHEFPATAYYEEGDDGITLDERWRKHWRPRPAWYQLRTNTPGPLTRLPGVEASSRHGTNITSPSRIRAKKILQPWRLSVHDVERNVRAYASLHGLNSNRSASLAIRPPRHVLLDWLPESRRLKSEWWTEEFDAVVIATSRHNEAKVPNIKGIGNWSAATENGRYPMYHSQAFRHAEYYAGKTVLIVGASVSATQISRLIAPFTNRLLASPNNFRDAYGLDILFSFDEKVEVVPEISSFEPLDGNNVGIKAGKIKLVNGVVLDGIDEIILATGYSTNTFLPDLKPTDAGQPPLDGHYIDDPTLVYTHSLRPWVYGTCCHGFARVFTGKARLPSRERMRAEYDSGKYRFGTPLDVVLQEAVRKLYSGWLNSEALELGGPVHRDPTNRMFTYFVNTHYKKDLLSHDDFTRLDSLPMSEWPKPGPPGSEYKVLDW
ncbi:hypothetical protein B0H14DRAFT_3763671 [Mycena olivaceomarginata]|nr:hypothetical protein B0H14DRAFT_3763671 [Mycena olivaceomarginata]